MQRYTINDFNRLFPDDDACLEWLRRKLYPAKIYCLRCKRISKHYRIRERKVYSCDLCGQQLSPTAGTIFHKSPTPLRLWFYAIYMISNSRTGISAKHLQRELGVTYKTAWRMFKQIRSILQEDVTLSGRVEVDETYVGGKRHGKPGRGAAGKTIVGGVVERKGRIVAKVVPNVKAQTLLPLIATHVLPKSTVYSDELPSYNRVGRMGYDHRHIHHAAKVYVNGDVHTNTIEGFWSLVKRSIGGAHHAGGAHYLQSYLNEYTFRWNHRSDEQPMFVAFLNRI
jgi:transposase